MTKTQTEGERDTKEDVGEAVAWQGWGGGECSGGPSPVILTRALLV